MRNNKVSCSIIPIEEFAKTTPFRPPTVKRNANPKVHIKWSPNDKVHPCLVANHLKILIPVDMAIIIFVAAM